MRTSILIALVLISSLCAPAGAAQTFAWSRVYGSATFDQAIDVATDTNDNVYVVGFFNASIDFDPGPGVVTRTSNGSNDIFVQKLDSDGNLVWVETFGGTGGDQAATIDVDSTGNVYVGGVFRNSVGLGSGLGATTLTSEGGEDAFLIKLDSAGGFLWARGWGSTNGDIVNGVAVAPGGDVAVAGWFSETMDLDPGVPVNDATSAGGTDIWVVRLDTNGNYLWGHGFGDTDTDVARDLAMDEDGNVLVAGDFRGGIDFDPGLGEDTRTAAGNSDLFIQKLTPTGTLDWVATLGAASAEVAFGVAADAVGNVFATGRFGATVDFDPAVPVASLTAVGADSFILKLAADGAYTWARRIGSNGNEQGQSIAADALGNVYTSGIFRATANFDPGISNFTITSAGNDDAYQHALDSAGNFLWATSVGGVDTDFGYGIAVDSASSVIAAGYFQGSADLDPIASTASTLSIGFFDGFAVKLTQDIVVVEGEGEEPLEICGDNIDNDTNGFIDCDDFACSSSEFCTGETSCGDGIDNDENGFTDCDDFACSTSEFCTGETSCGDGIDNDENGFTDCDDFACAGSPACTEGEGIADGEGVVEGEGAVEGEGIVEGEGVADGEGGIDGEGVTEGEGTIEGVSEGGAEGEGVAEGEGSFDGEGVAEGEGTIEGESEGDVEGEGVAEGEGIVEGEGLVEGEGITEGEGEGTAEGDGEAVEGIHASDQNGDFQVALTELLRVIQLYNAGEFHCAENLGDTEDGYIPGAGTNQFCEAYDTDYNPQDWVISLSELLRIIQYYNFGGYNYCPTSGTEDGYCPGL